MDFYLLNDSSVILLGSPAGLYEVNGPDGPGGPGSNIPNFHSGVGNLDGTKPKAQTTTAAQTTVEETLTPEEKALLEALDNKPNSPKKSDPNNDGGLRQAQTHQEQVAWLRAVLGDKLGRALSKGNASKLQSAEDVGKALYQGSRSDVRALLGKLKAIQANLPEGAKADLKFIGAVIESVTTQAALEGQNLSVQSSSASSDNLQQLQAQQAQLKQLNNQAKAFLMKLLPPAALKKFNLGPDAGKIVREGVEQLFDNKAKVLNRDLAAAQRRGDANKVRQLTAQLKDLQGQRALALKQGQVAVKVLRKIDQLLRTGSSQEIQQFVEGQGVRAFVSEIKDKNLNQLEEFEARLDAFAAESEATPRSQTSSAGEAAAPVADEASMGAQSATATSGTGSDEPIDAIEAAKKVLMEEGQDVAADDLGEMGAQSATQSAEDHATIQSDWSQLSDSDIKMQIASTSVSMGITSSYYSARSKERKLKSMMQKLLRAIENGNMDAITEALILISYSTQQTLSQAASLAIQAMTYYDQQQEANNKMIEDVAKNPGASSAADLQLAANKSSQIGTARQAIMSVLRQINSAHHEMQNQTKSWLDANNSHQQSLARWNA